MLYLNSVFLIVYPGPYMRYDVSTHRPPMTRIYLNIDQAYVKCSNFGDISEVLIKYYIIL